MDARFQVCFTPLPGFFSPFPHGTGSLSVITECLGLEGGPPGFGRGFTCPALLGIPVGSAQVFGYGAVTRCGPAFQLCPPSLSGTVSESRNPGKQASRFGLLRFRSPLLTQSHRFLFLQVLRCFTSLRVASADYVFIRRWPPMKAAGLPHSEISGSKPVDGSPKLVAVFRVLHSLLMPRHPSCARIRLAEFAAARPFASARRPRLPSA